MYFIFIPALPGPRFFEKRTTLLGHFRKILANFRELRPFPTLPLFRGGFSLQLKPKSFAIASAAAARDNRLPPPILCSSPMTPTQCKRLPVLPPLSTFPP